MRREPNMRWWIIKEYARRLKVRHGHPPTIPKKECAVAEMPVGRGGYLWEVAVDGDGRLYTFGHSRVLPSALWPYPECHYVERVSETAYDLTVWRTLTFDPPQREPSEPVVRFRSVFTCENQSHPHYKREPLHRGLPDDEESVA